MFYLLHRYEAKSQFIKDIKESNLKSSSFTKEKLAEEYDKFGLGSRIIVTTRNKHLLVKHFVQFKLECLSEEDCFKLFSLYASKYRNPKEGYNQLSQNIEDFYSLEPALALHRQSSLSQTWSQCPQNDESSVGVTFTILNRYLQVISSSLSLSNW